MARARPRLRHAHSPHGQRPVPHHQEGTGLVASAAGTTVFLIFLLFAVQLLVNLYAASTTTAAGLDAARTVASRDVDHGSPSEIAAAQARAEARFRQVLGRAANKARLSWDVDATTVRLHVIVPTPTILPRAWGPTTAFGVVDRTFVVRAEGLS